MLPHRHTLSVLAVLLGVVLTTPAAAQTTYRWIDKASGQTVYSDQPPPPGVRYSTQGRTSTGEASDEASTTAPSSPSSPSYAVRQAAAKYPVVLYTAAHCTDPCQQARTLLNGRGVPFAERMLGTPKDIEDFTKRFGDAAGIPSMSVGQQTVSGLETGAWNNLLDLAGYPKTAPYGSKPAISSPQ